VSSCPIKKHNLTRFRSLESMGLQNLNSKGLRYTYSGRTVSARTQRNTQTLTILHYVCKFASNAVETTWSIFWKKHDFYAKGLQRLKIWGMIEHRLKFRTCKVPDVYWIFVGFNKIFMGSVFWVPLYESEKRCYVWTFCTTLRPDKLFLLNITYQVPCLQLVFVLFTTCL